MRSHYYIIVTTLFLFCQIYGMEKDQQQRPSLLNPSYLPDPIYPPSWPNFHPSYAPNSNWQTYYEGMSLTLYQQEDTRIKQVHTCLELLRTHPNGTFATITDEQTRIKAGAIVASYIRSISLPSMHESKS